MSSVKLVAITKPVIEGVNTAEEFVAYAARVSNPSNQMNTDTAPKLLNYLIKNLHWSPFEMVQLVMEINTTRDIARQILRHRSFSFQEFCVAGDTAISLEIKSSGKKIRRNISDLYSLSKDELAKYSVRSYDQETKTLKYFNIKEVFSTGNKPLQQLTLDNGKTIKCTQEHKFLTKDGFKPLQDLSVGDFLAHNGIAVYQDKVWLESAKQTAIETGTGVQGIADLAECSYHTIRKWLKVHGLQFSKKEVASYTPIWNKGLAKEEQPRYGKCHTESTRQKMRDSARSGEDSNLYSSGDYTRDKISFRRRIAQISGGYLTALKIRQQYKCAICARDITNKDDINLGVEVDHIKPVSTYPELALDPENMQAVCLDPCHANKSAYESSIAAETVLYSKIVSIVDVGVEPTYDLEVDNINHNYVANGIISHNSQRYANAEGLGFSSREARMQDPKNRQASNETNDRELQDTWEEIQATLLGKVRYAYNWALSNGIAKEQARAVLPEGLTNSRMYMSGTLRSWIHYCEIRSDISTQKEHRLIAVQAQDILKTEFPSLFNGK